MFSFKLNVTAANWNLGKLQLIIWKNQKLNTVLKEIYILFILSLHFKFLFYLGIRKVERFSLLNSYERRWMFRIMEYEKRIEGKNFKEFHRISETKEKFIQELILAGTLASHLRGSCLCGISPHLRLAFILFYNNCHQCCISQQGSVGNC